MPRRPNVILCTCDQLRRDELGCYGSTQVRSPNLDQFASTGVRFDAAISSYPVCLAARSSMLSGQYPRRCTGGSANVTYQTDCGSFTLPQYPYDGRPHLPDPTLPELLRQAGYYNAAIGKWHIHSWPNDVGFDQFTIPRVHHCHSGQLYTRNGGPEFSPPGWSQDFEADEVEAFLKQRAGEDQPFFLYYNLAPPHCPVADAPEKYLTMYRPEDVKLRPNVDLSKPVENQDYSFRVYRWDFRYYLHHLPYTRELPRGYSLRHVIAEYYGMVTWVDDTFGRLMRSMNAMGLDENTIVIFTSDHGDNLGSHGLVQKGTFNEEAIGIPMIIRAPGGSHGGAVGGQVASLVDLMPTVLNLAGIDIPSHVHGQNLSGFLGMKAPKPERDYSFVETQAGAAIRTPRHIYQLAWSNPPAYRTPAGSELVEHSKFLFDLQADPFQMHRLSTTGESGAIARDLDTRLRQWNRELTAKHLPA